MSYQGHFNPKNDGKPGQYTNKRSNLLNISEKIWKELSILYIFFTYS